MTKETKKESAEEVLEKKTKKTSEARPLDNLTEARLEALSNHRKSQNLQ